MMLTGQARLAGVIGWPVGHSLSPALHGYWIEQMKIDAAYVPLAVQPDDLPSVIAALPKMGFKGANVTLPHKESVLRLAGTVDETARACGAANTLIVQDEGVRALNTDVSGFMEALAAEGVTELAGRRVVVLGAGGAARAVIYGLLSGGVREVVVVNRTPGNAEALAAFFGSRVRATGWQDVAKHLPACGLLVNTTKLGMVGEDVLKVPLEPLPDEAVVVDIVYRPLETQLLSDARCRGLKTVDGLGMLLHQAVPGFEAWFGVKPRVSADLRAHLVSIIQGRPPC